MAIIAGQAPDGAQPEAAGEARVVVKLSSVVPESRDLENSTRGITDSFPGLRFRPYFDERGTDPEDMTRGISPESVSRSPEMGSYLVTEAPRNEAVAIAEQLTSRTDVDLAYVEGGPTPPPAPPENDPLAPQQRYLDPKPAGIDAREAWNFADGSNVGLVDLEQGWTLDHEDLAARGVTLISGVNKAYPGHGTAVLGQLVATRNNTRGGVGIAPGAATRVISQWRTNSQYSTAIAIRAAADAMNAGDVLLLEAQTIYQTSGSNFVPVEVEQLAFEAIRYATATKGIIVIEAAGNGSVDLDAFADVRGKKILNHSSPDFQDSGAIMIGAASAAAPHSRLYFSNYGSRVDCFAWGEQIATCGDGWQGNARNTYTSQFGGTSGASPIVTGAAVLLQSWAKSQGRRYTPQTMRKLCSDTALNTPSANPPQDRIGVMPDLKAIIRHESLRGPVASANLANAGTAG